MKIRAFPQRVKRFFFQGTLLLLFAAGFSSCANKALRPEQTRELPEVMGPPVQDPEVESHELPREIYGPEPLPSSPGPAGPEEARSRAEPPSGSTQSSAEIAAETTAPVAGEASPAPQPSPPAPAAEPGRLCLVLGPGMAKAMAQAGVLEVLRKAKIPVHCVVGSEMGALVGALYAHSNGSTNNLSWQLFKVTKENYFAFPLLSLQEPKSSGARLNELLRGFFRSATIESLPIRFATVAVDDEAESAVDLDRGDLADALSASLAVPGVFEPWKIGGKGYHSAAGSEPAPLELARRLGGNFLVLVDVLLDPGSAGAKSRFHKALSASRSLLRLRKKEAQFVIQIGAGAIAYDEFTRKGELLAAGTAAGEKALPELKAAWERWSAGAH